MAAKKSHDQEHRDACQCWCANPHSVCPRTPSEGTSCRIKPSASS